METIWETTSDMQPYLLKEIKRCWVEMYLIYAPCMEDLPTFGLTVFMVNV